LIYVFWGEDDYSIEETLQTLKKSLGDPSMLLSNTSIFDGQKLNLNELRAVGEAMPFLAEKRLIIVKGLLEHFENKDKSGRPKKNGDSSKKQTESQSLADAIKGFPESTVLVLVDNIEVKSNSLKNNSLYQDLLSKAEVRTFPTLKGPKLFQWIQTRVNQMGGSISRQATSLLMDLVGGNLHVMANEIGKLVAFTAGCMIEEKDIRQVVSAAQEADVFIMVDAIMDHKVGQAEQILQKLLQNGVAPTQMLVLLARQVQMLVQLKDLKSQKKPISEIQSKLGIFNEFVWNKIYSRAEKYSLDQLKGIYQNLLQTDLSIKTGRLEGDLALNLLVAEMAEK
jgi:DNA polymerase III subunit delta